MDYLIKTNKDLIEEVVFYGDGNINKDRFLPQEEIDFDEASQGFIDDDDIIIEEDKTEEVFFEEQKQRDIFIRMYNSTKFKNVQQMYDSWALKWSKNKIAKTYEYYNLNLDFPVDQRYSYSPSIKKLTEAAKILHRCYNTLAIFQQERLLIYFLSLN